MFWSFGVVCRERPKQVWSALLCHNPYIRRDYVHHTSGHHALKRGLSVMTKDNLNCSLLTTTRGGINTTNKATILTDEGHLPITTV